MTKSLKQLKQDHKIFFENKVSGERYNVYKGFLITTAAYDYRSNEITSKVWQENEHGNLFPIGRFASVTLAKYAIDELVQ